jgi:glycosyltransferase involved in cell wall biosynthesis
MKHRPQDGAQAFCVWQGCKNKIMADITTGVTIIIPVYNSGEILPLLVKRLEPVLSGLGEPHELILVNDGSRDSSWEVIQKLTAEHPWVRGICMMRNYGQHNALLCGIRAARFKIIMTMDDDLQHPPEELPKLLAALTDELDVVYAPPLDEQHGILRDLASIITKMALQTTMGAANARSASAWRVFRTHLREAFAQFQSPWVSIDVLLTWGTTRFGALPLRHDARAVGKSNYTLGKLIRHAFNMMTGFSVLPLQIASLIGFVFTLFGVGVLVRTLISYMIFGSVVEGFTFLASIIAIFSGATLFTLGVIGEYLARMHFRIMEKPVYCVREKAGE